MRTVTPRTVLCVGWLLLGSATATRAQIQGIDVRPGAETVIEVDPDRPVTASVIVTNGRGTPVAFTDVVEASGDLRAVFDMAPFLLRPGERAARLITLLIPTSMVAGSYEVTYRVQTSEGAVSLPVRLSVVVPPEVGYQVHAISQDGIATAGARYAARFAVENTGNTPVSLEFDARAPEGLVTEVVPRILRLDPGRTESVEAFVAVPASWRRSGRLQVELLTRLQDGPADQADIAKADVAVLVRARARFDRHRYPLSVAFSAGAMQSALDGTEPYLRTIIQGEGPVREDGATTLRLLARTPTQTVRVSSLSQRDEYVLDLRNPRFQVAAGDVIQSVSALAGGSSYGFGGLGNLDLGIVRAGVYTTRDRFARSHQREETGGFIGIRPAGFLNLGLNAVERKGDLYPGRVVSLGVGLRAARYFSADAEYGIGSPGESDIIRTTGSAPAKGGSRPTGASIQMRAGASALQGYARYVRTGERFPSSRGGRSEIQSGVAFRPRSAWAVSGTYSYLSFRNPFLSGSSASFGSHVAQADVAFRAPRGLRLKGGYTGRGQESSIGATGYGFWNHLGFLEVAREFGSVSVVGRPSAGVAVGVTGTTIPVFGGSVAAGVRLFRGSAGLDLDFTYFEGPYGSAPVVGQTVRFASGGLGFGGRLGSRVQADLRVAGTYQRTGPENYQSVFGSLRVDYRTPWNHTLSLAGISSGLLFSRSGLTNYSEIALTYRIPLNAPLWRSQKTGLVAGRLLDGGTGRGLPGAAVFVGSDGSLTDGDGRFIIPSIPVGSYAARIDMLDPSASYVLRDQGSATVRGAKRNELDLVAVPAASVTGRVVVRDPLAANAPDAGVPNVIVTLHSGSVDRTQFSDGSGRFSFTGLTDGTYLLEAPETSLGEEYYASTRPVEVRLGPGENRQLDILLASRRSMIQFKPLESAAGRDGAPGVAPGGTPVPDETHLVHTVADGEDLFDLARTFYDGDWRKWQVIYDANQASIPDVGRLQPGVVLRIPRIAPDGSRASDPTAPANDLAAAARTLPDGARPLAAAVRPLPGADPTVPPTGVAANQPPAADSRAQRLPAARDDRAERNAATDQDAGADGGSVSYVVRAGDTLFQIARLHFGGDAGRWREILDANTDRIPDKDHLRPGITLRIPQGGSFAEERPGRQPVVTAGGSESILHTVRAGDTLFQLARRYFDGNALKWRVIYDANAAVIVDKDRLEPGTVLRIPGSR